jgi:hypothetical protein
MAQPPGPDASLYSKVGEAIGLLQGVHQRLDDIDARMRERSEEARRQEDRLQAELRTVKHDQRNHEQIIGGQLDLLRSDMRKLETRVSSVSDTVSALQGNQETTNKAVQDMKAPLDQLVGLRNRGAALMLAFASFITVLWVVVEPVWQFLAQKLALGFLK